MLALFWRLILAHLIADFPLQTDTIYKLKIKGLWGQILHAQILFITSCILVFPYLHLPPIWVYLFLITFLHTIQDRTKVEHFNKFLYPFWPFFFDQLLHFLTTAIIFVFPLQNLKPFILASHPLWQLYNNDLLVYFLIGYLLSTWHGTYFIDTFNRAFLKERRLNDLAVRQFVGKQEKFYGILERAIWTTFAFWGGLFYLLIPAVGALRFLFKKLRSPATSLLGLLLSLAAGITLRILSL